MSKLFHKGEGGVTVSGFIRKSWCVWLLDDVISGVILGTSWICDVAAYWKQAEVGEAGCFPWNSNSNISAEFFAGWTGLCQKCFQKQNRWQQTETLPLITGPIRLVVGGGLYVYGNIKMQ